MASVAAFIRHTPPASLAGYFKSIGIAVPSMRRGNSTDKDLNVLVAAMDRLDENLKSQFLSDIERISGMADEAGQVALNAVVADRIALDAMENGYERALEVYLADRDAFRHAEEVRFADEHRRGRMWDGYIGLPGLPVRRDAKAIERFKASIRERFETKNVHVDIFDRHRPALDGKNYKLIQTTVYRDGRLDDFLEFENGTLARRSRRPVYEAALSYEPSTGVIEVVANVREHRADFVQFFAQNLLEAELKRKLPLRRYDLSPLLEPHDFSTDPQDGIASVRVILLRLMPLDAAGERLTLECGRDSSRTIWQMAAERFGSDNPLRGGWVITRAKLTIRFHPDKDSRRGRTLPLGITMPHGCDLKDRNECERVVGDKYLRRWGILTDV